MPNDSKETDALFNEEVYADVVQWITANPYDARLKESVKHDLLRFKSLEAIEKKQLKSYLLIGNIRARLPEIIRQFAPIILEELPGELIDQVGSNLNQQALSGFIESSKQNYYFFRTRKSLSKFLEYVAYGQQVKAYQLLTEVFKGQDQKIQEALKHKGEFTDRSGRTFNCTAYEYAYWARDTHMCRMLEARMDEDTKAFMLERINEIEKHGLSYQQNGKKHRSAHFDLIQLIEALQECVEAFNGKPLVVSSPPVEEARTKVRHAQRDLPIHIIQEYCRHDRSFKPCPQFDESTLPRTLTFYNGINDCDDSWFPGASDAGLILSRAEGKIATGSVRIQLRWTVATDLKAIRRLDQVRTEDLKLSREHLNPLSMSQGLKS